MFNKLHYITEHYLAVYTIVKRQWMYFTMHNKTMQAQSGNSAYPTNTIAMALENNVEK
jgi:hypothetical protein